MPTITEALSDIKMLDKRIAKRREHITTFLTRQADHRDPLEAQGGAIEVIKRNEQSIRDLAERIVTIRRLISQANHDNTITLRSETRSIFDWLTWRRDVAPRVTTHYQQMRRIIDQARRNANAQGGRSISALSVNVTQDLKDKDILVNIDEDELARTAEDHEAKLENLDGQLSLKNATITIDYEIPTEEERPA